MKSIDFAVYYFPEIEIKKILLTGPFIYKKSSSKMQRHTVSMTPKNWEFGECSKPRIDLKLKISEVFFPGGEY